MITADTQRDLSDPRPESQKIRFKSIRYERRLGRAEAREHLDRSPYMCRSVEELRERSRSEGISLGIVKPREIVDVWLEPRSEEERESWAQKEFEVTQQLLLFGEPSKPLDFPEAKFFVRWLCDDSRCTKPHEMSLHQWGIHELYRKLRLDPEGGEKIRGVMRKHLDLRQREVYFFLGTFRAIQNNFGLMDVHDFAKTSQLSLGLSMTEESGDEWGKWLDEET